ncbi:MAG: short-chain fatty acyl-CoA regulator family protein, partial [Parvularculales bacterium]
LDKIMSRLPDTRSSVRSRCKIELANYFAASLLMPYEAFITKAVETDYDIDRLATRFSVSFEQACHRLTTLQRDGNEGIPFFFLRVDKAGNVTKRFNATSFQVAEYGGACPVWNLHTAFRTPGVIIPQFVELPDGERFFTLARTTDRPAFSSETQDRRLVLALGCSIEHCDKLIYATPYARKDIKFSEIGINCHLCLREGCSQRAHQPMLAEFDIDPNRG